MILPSFYLNIWQNDDFYSHFSFPKNRTIKVLHNESAHEMSDAQISCTKEVVFEQRVYVSSNFGDRFK